jgi:hypothetical protein
MREARYVSLIPRTTLHSDSEHFIPEVSFLGIHMIPSQWRAFRWQGLKSNFRFSEFRMSAEVHCPHGRVTLVPAEVRTYLFDRSNMIMLLVQIVLSTVSSFILYYCSVSYSVADPGHFDTDPAFQYWSGSDLPFQRDNAPKTVLFVQLNLIFIVNRYARNQPEGIFR